MRNVIDLLSADFSFSVVSVKSTGVQEILDYASQNSLLFCSFVLRFYGPFNPMESCRARSVYLTTCLLGRLSPLSG